MINAATRAATSVAGSWNEPTPGSGNFGDAAVASCSKRRSRSESEANDAGKTLMATSRRSRARGTLRPFRLLRAAIGSRSLRDVCPLPA